MDGPFHAQRKQKSSRNATVVLRKGDEIKPQLRTRNCNFLDMISLLYSPLDGSKMNARNGPSLILPTGYNLKREENKVEDEVEEDVALHQEAERRRPPSSPDQSDCSSTSDSIPSSVESTTNATDAEFAAINTLVFLNQKRKQFLNSNSAASAEPTLATAGVCPGPSSSTYSVPSAESMASCSNIGMSYSQPVGDCSSSESGSNDCNGKMYDSDPEMDRRSSLAPEVPEYSRKRKIYKYCDDRERRENKRDQNKEAAKRYREKKKTEAERYFKEMNELETINRKRKQRIKELEKEKLMLIQSLKGIKPV